MRVLVLSSGGKDSALATWWAICRGWEVAGSVTVSVKGEDSWMFQIPGVALAGLQAKAAGIGWMRVDVSGEQEVEVDQLEAALRPVVKGEAGPKFDADSWPEGWQLPQGIDAIQRGGPIDAIVSGALASEYQRRRLERMAHRLGVISYTPMWHNEAGTHMRDLVESGFEMVMTSVSCDGLGKEWLGRRLDPDSLAGLEMLAPSYRFSIDGEGGEFETSVLAAPHMRGRIVLESVPKWRGSRGELLIEDATLHR